MKQIYILFSHLNRYIIEIYKNFMIPAKPPEKLSAPIRGNALEQLIQSGIPYSQAIENADGVPFQLMFGPEPGQGHYMKVGSGIRQLLGIDPEEFTEKVFFEMILEIVPLSGDISSDLSESRKRIINGDLINYKAEVLVQMRGGEKKWIMDSSLPLIDEETGKAIGVFGILFDIDERKKALECLEKAKEKADESDRYKAAFLRNISHEIRTPLNAIVGFSSLLYNNRDGSEINQEFLDIICRSSDHLLDIIDDIVEISNIETNSISLKKEKININSELRKLYNHFSLIADKKKISFSYTATINDSNVIINTDITKLTRILKSLIDNSLKFTINGAVEFGYSVKGNMIEFFVSDTGIGIPPEKQSLIFNKFYQAESSSTRRFEGTGLGLSISRAYIELLGGNIWFSSDPGIGSVFFFTIPNI